MDVAVEVSLEVLARTQFGVFSRAQARAAGATPHEIQHRLDSKRWGRVAPSVYRLRGWPSTFEQRAMIAHLHAGPGSFLSFQCGAMLRNLDAIQSAVVAITVPRRLRSIPNGVRVHYSTDATVYDWSMVGPLPVATPTRILIDLAGTSTSLNTLERIYECANRRGEITPDLLDEAVNRLARKGKPGIVKARALVKQIVRDGKRNGSDAETIFFQILRDANLPLPTRQRMVMREDGSHAYTDYAYDGIDAVLEVLGFDSHSRRVDLTNDAERNNDINLLKKTLLEFTWTHLTKDPNYVIRTVRRLLRDNNML